MLNIPSIDSEETLLKRIPKNSVDLYLTLPNADFLDFLIESDDYLSALYFMDFNKKAQNFGMLRKNFLAKFDYKKRNCNFLSCLMRISELELIDIENIRELCYDSKAISFEDREFIFSNALFEYFLKFQDFNALKIKFSRKIFLKNFVKITSKTKKIYDEILQKFLEKYKKEFDETKINSILKEERENKDVFIFIMANFEIKLENLESIIVEKIVDSYLELFINNTLDINIFEKSNIILFSQKLSKNYIKKFLDFLNKNILTLKFLLKDFLKIVKEDYKSQSTFHMNKNLISDEILSFEKNIYCIGDIIDLFLMHNTKIIINLKDIKLPNMEYSDKIILENKIFYLNYKTKNNLLNGIEKIENQNMEKELENIFELELLFEGKVGLKKVIRNIIQKKENLRVKFSIERVEFEYLIELAKLNKNFKENRDVIEFLKYICNEIVEYKFEILKILSNESENKRIKKNILSRDSNIFEKIEFDQNYINKEILNNELSLLEDNSVPKIEKKIKPDEKVMNVEKNDTITAITDKEYLTVEKRTQNFINLLLSDEKSYNFEESIKVVAENFNENAFEVFYLILTTTKRKIPQNLVIKSFYFLRNYIKIELFLEIINSNISKKNNSLIVKNVYFLDLIDYSITKFALNLNYFAELNFILETYDRFSLEFLIENFKLTNDEVLITAVYKKINSDFNKQLKIENLMVQDKCSKECVYHGLEIRNEQLDVIDIVKKNNCDGFKAFYEFYVKKPVNDFLDLNMNKFSKNVIECLKILNLHKFDSNLSELENKTEFDFSLFLNYLNLKGNSVIEKNETIIESLIYTHPSTVLSYDFFKLASFHIQPLICNMNSLIRCPTFNSKLSTLFSNSKIKKEIILEILEQSNFFNNLIFIKTIEKVELEVDQAIKIIINLDKSFYRDDLIQILKNQKKAEKEFKKYYKTWKKKQKFEKICLALEEIYNI